MRSDNLRGAPGFFTPELVRRVLDQIEKPLVIDAAVVPVVRIAQPKPVLRLVKPQTCAESQTDRKCLTAKRAPSGRLIATKLPIHEQPEFQELTRIADRRGIAVVDLARAVGVNQQTVLVATKRLGHAFGKRHPLADPLTREQLLALVDETLPLPELRRDRLKRERYEKWNAYKRDQRADDVARRKAERGERRAAEVAARKAERAKRRAAEIATRDVARAQRAAAKSAKTAPREAKHQPAGQARRCAAPREPAPSSPARAQSVQPAVPLTRGAPRHVAYAERIAAARAYLESRHFSVRRHDRDAIIASWHVSGWSGCFSNEQLVALAVHHGLELPA